MPSTAFELGSPTSPVIATTPEFTWWNYRPGQFDKDHGLRIDLALCSSVVADVATDVWVDRTARTHERPSDHAPLVVDLAL